jgi:DNA polymerase elongation subunit (family B)
MEERDAGNKPQVGDRLAYIYVSSRKDEKKQGDKIENVDYVREKKLKPDTEFYITNQIQNPVAQLFALAIEQLDGYRKKDYNKFYDQYRETLDEEEATLKVLKLKEKDLDSLLFMSADYMLKAQGKPIQSRLDSYFTKR